MGTRGNVVVQEQGQNIVRIYRHFDTYPEGLGADLVSILQGAEIINGIRAGQQAPAFFNGMGCMAAYLVGKLKGDSIGNVRLELPDEEPDGLFIEYVYTLYLPAETETDFGVPVGPLHIKCETIHGGAGHPVSFEGPGGDLFESMRYGYITLYDGPLAGFDPATASAKQTEIANAICLSTGFREA
jgi:hypothetical protein